MVTGEESRFLILFLTGTFAFCLIAVGFILFYFKSVKKIYQKQLQLEKNRLEHQQELLKNAIRVEEQERRRFSRDLHDEAGALLAGIKLKMKLIQQDAGDPGRVRQLSLEAREMLGTTIQSVRNISHNLLPPSLETFGLFRCLEGFFRDLQASVETDFQYETDRERLPPEVELAMYRIVSELCNNTLKHANAGKITMHLQVEGNNLKAVYQDNGKGMDTGAARDPEVLASGLGFKNIESRIAMLSGTITLDSAPGKGMDVRIEISL
ncbi:signal transduction histidine kinase [Anseongella ginsenosidimutans]|uniref:histidine kinase n=1 Tax=Anseongella ginsenosidimutans TaxID=496056 RepID=A0A4R3KW97_9SPHI|nr:hypothetical protein FRZ59_13940 [Anseongella ginsenosidimutans]TCS88211.1 signal transduction histidine kinase [Anseongella ginsenosidimutans]